MEEVPALRPAEGGGRGRPEDSGGSEINEPASLRRASVSEEGEASRSITGSGESITQTYDLVKADKKGGDFGGEGSAGGPGDSAGALGAAFSAAGTSIGSMKSAKPNKVVSAKTRKLLEERLMGAGRTMEEAAADAEVAIRQQTNLARITGADPNAIIRQKIHFAREGEAAGAGGFHHSELSIEKRRKYEALTALEVSSKEIKSLRGPGEFTKRLVEWAHDKGLFDKFTNLDSGMDNIEFNAASVRSVKQHNAGDRKLAILQAAPELIKHGIYLESTKRNEQGLVSHIFAGKVKIDESENVVGFVIREDVNGRRYYDHRVVYLADKNTGREVEASRPSRPDQGATPSKRVTDYDDIVTIVKKHLGVKPDATFE